MRRLTPISRFGGALRKARYGMHNELLLGRAKRESWSDQAASLLDLLGQGETALLVRRGSRSSNITEAALVRFSHDGPVNLPAPVALDAVQEVVHRGAVRPLSQFRWFNFIGWREIVGSLGETWDVYLMTQ